MADPVFKHAADLGNNGGAGTLTVSYTVDAASNYLYVAATGDTSSDNINAPTFNGVTMTLITKVQSSRWHYGFELFNPATGAHNVVITQSSPGFIIANAADYANVDTRNDARTDHDAGNTAITSTIAATSVDNGLLVCSVMGFTGGFDPPEAGTGATRRTFDATFGTVGIFDGNTIITPAGSSASIQTTKPGTAELGQIAFVLNPQLGTSVNITGQSATATLGTLTTTNDKNITITGQSSTATLGTPTLVIGQVIFMDGFPATATLGTPTLTVSSNVSITSQLATASLGTPTPISVGSLTIDAFVEDIIYQESAGLSGINKVFTGTYTGSLSSLSIRIEKAGAGTAVVDYTTLTSFTTTPGSPNTWQGTAFVPTGTTANTWYQAKVREPVTLTASSLQTFQWGVGDVIFMPGHSLIAYLYDFGTNEGHAPYTRVRRWLGNTAFIDPSLVEQSGEVAASAAYGCAGLNAMIDQLIENETTGRPILIVPRWSGGATTQILIDTWDSTWMAEFTGVGITDFVAVFPQGLIPQCVDLDVSSIATKLNTLHQRFLTFTGRSASDFKFIQPLDGCFEGGNDTSAVNLRAAAYAKSLTTGCYFGGNQIPVPNGSDQHYTQPAGAVRAGRIIGQSIAYAFGNETVSPYGPDVTAASWALNTDKIYVQTRQRGGTALLDGAGASTAAITNSSVNFSVTASGGQTISSQDLVAGQIVLTMSAVRGAGETVFLNFMYRAYLGDTHVNTHDVVDNQNAVLGDTIGRYMLPTFTSITVVESLSSAALNSFVGGRGRGAGKRLHIRKRKR